MDANTKKVMFSSESVEWGTPQDLYDRRNALFDFELDVCASESNHKHVNYIAQEENAFHAPWIAPDTGGRPARCWMNPPYCRQEQVCKKPETCKKKRCAKRGCHTTSYVPGLYQWVELAKKRSQEGCLVDCLLPGKPGSKWWNEFVWDNTRSCLRDNVRLFCIPNRLVFEGAQDSAPFDSVLVTFLPQH